MSGERTAKWEFWFLAIIVLYNKTKYKKNKIGKGMMWVH